MTHLNERRAKLAGNQDDRVTPENAALYKGRLVEKRWSVSGHQCWYEPVVTEWKAMGLPSDPEEIIPLVDEETDEEE